MRSEKAVLDLIGLIDGAAGDLGLSSLSSILPREINP